MATPYDDLPELDEKLRQSINNLQVILNIYDTNGPVLVQEVVRRLRQLEDPPGYHAEEAVEAAEELESALKKFQILRLGLMTSVLSMRLTMDSAIFSLKIHFLNSAAKDSLSIKPDQMSEMLQTVGQYLLHLKDEIERSAEDTSANHSPSIEPDQNVSEALEALEQHGQHLKDSVEQSAEDTSAIAKLVGSLAIDAFNAATEIVTFRMIFLMNFLEATNPVKSITSSEGRSYEIGAVRNAVATETIIFAGEEALKRIGLEMVKQIPVASIVASLTTVIIDVRNEVRHFNEIRVLWEKIIQAPLKRNLAEEALINAKRIRKDDEHIRQASQSILNTAQRLDELTNLLLKS